MALMSIETNLQGERSYVANESQIQIQDDQVSLKIYLPLIISPLQYDLLSFFNQSYSDVSIIIFRQSSLSRTILRNLSTVSFIDRNHTNYFSVTCDADKKKHRIASLFSLVVKLVVNSTSSSSQSF